MPKRSSQEEAAVNATYDAFMKEGIAAEKAKNYSDALTKYYHAMDLKPDSAEVYKALARIYLFKRDFNNARDYYKESVQKYKASRDPKFEEQLIILAHEIADEQENKKIENPANSAKQN